MDKEFDFWMNNRTVKVNVNGEDFTLAHYDVEVDAPRPGNFYISFHHKSQNRNVVMEIMMNDIYMIIILESYREDYTDAKEFFHDNKVDEQQFYINMKSGAESGWDYSTKWCVKLKLDH